MGERLASLPLLGAELSVSEGVGPPVQMGVWTMAAGQDGEPIRQPRDRLTGQLQERSLIAGGASTPFLAPNARGGLPLE